MRAAVAALCLALLVGAARAEDDVGKELTKAGRAYFDPDLEFLFRARKDFADALARAGADHGIDPLADVPWLRRVVMQSRRFKPRFSDKRWLRDEGVKGAPRSGPYFNLASEAWRLAWTEPRSDRGGRRLDRIPRTPPLPLLLSILDESALHDEKGRASKYPGAEVLRRRYPPQAFEALYDDWFLVAPVAARAKFLADDGTIRHRFLTHVLTEFWRRYHVDFDRIVVDGGAPAAALAAAFPSVFAGLVLRGNPTVDLDVVPNYATIPVFVAGDERLARELELRGHPDVSVGDDEALRTWLAKRRRTAAKDFSWRRKNGDHRFAHWIDVASLDARYADQTLDVRILDSAIDPNTIWIEARGIERVHLFLNDEIVDLDRPVRLVVNGRERMEQHLERDLAQLFEKDPNIRRNMNFGWLYPVLLPDVLVPVPEAGPSVVEIPPVPEDTGLPDDVRFAAEREWIEGRPDRLERHLGPALETRTAESALPFALRDLWWRRTDAGALKEHLEGLGWSGLLSDQYLWILGGGDGPYPTATEGDPWPILTALVRERQQRETTGARWLPDESPVVRRKLPEQPAEWQDWYERLCTWFYEGWMRPAYEGENESSFDEDLRAEIAAQDDLARNTRLRNVWLTILAGLVFAGGAFVASRRLSQRE